MKEPLPSHIGGYQHLVPDEITRYGDIMVMMSIPLCFCTPGLRVSQIEEVANVNVYRRIPVAKQGGDPQIWAVEEKRIREGTLAELTRAAAEGPPTETANAHSATDGYMPTDAATRKRIPIYSGFLRYFPRAVAAVAELSRIGNDQHNPGQPLHWDRSKSGDEADALMRHLIECDAVDKDGVPHAVKVAWRGMALAEKFLEKQEK